jgi:hypothetical protein
MMNPRCSRFRFLIPLFMLALVAVLGLAVYGLWNGVLAQVVGVKPVTYWQALGILILARILFGGFPRRPGGPFGAPWGRRMMWKRWQSLTPEQRAKMREEMRQRFGDWPMPPWCDSESGDAKKADETKKPSEAS